jgi:hypothetical protein
VHDWLIDLGSAMEPAAQSGRKLALPVDLCHPQKQFGVQPWQAVTGSSDQSFDHSLY